MQTVESIGVRFSLEKEIEACAQAREERESCQKSGMEFAPRMCAHHACARPGVRVCARACAGGRFGDFLFFSFSTDVFRLVMSFDKNLKLTSSQ